MEDKEGIEGWEKVAKDLAESHVSGFLDILRPLLIEHMIHGFKYGMEFDRVNSVSCSVLRGEQCLYYQKERSDPLGGSKNGE